MLGACPRLATGHPLALLPGGKDEAASLARGPGDPEPWDSLRRELRAVAGEEVHKQMHPATPLNEDYIDNDIGGNVNENFRPKAKDISDKVTQHVLPSLARARLLGGHRRQSVIGGIFRGLLGRQAGRGASCHAEDGAEVLS